MKTATKPQKDLTQGALIPQIILFSLPIMATSVLQLLFNTADTIVVGRWGGDDPVSCANSLAAVGCCASLIKLMGDFFLGVGIGSGVCVANGIGAKEYGEVRKVVHTSVLTSFIAGLAVMIFGLVAAPFCLQMMGTDPAIIDEATLYIRAYFLGMPATVIYFYCSSMLRSSGDSTRPLIFLSIAGVANVLLNLLTVIVFRWGAFGVGIATAVSQWISCFLILGYMIRSDGPCHLSLKELRIHTDKLKRILWIGIPAGIQYTFFAISNVLIQSAMNPLGSTAVAGNTAASNLDSYVYATQNAFYQTALTFVGQCAGAKKYQRLKKSILCCIGMVTLVGLSVGGLMLLFGEPLLRLYAPENDGVIYYGMIRLSVFCLTYFIGGLMETGCGALNGFGKSVSPMVITLLGSCVFRIVWIFTVFAWIPDLFVLYLSYPISWGLTAMVQFIFCFVHLKKRMRENKAVLNVNT
ncbi:MAG: MATE family efflux transporter [Clostridia bacterium]|nr:MATE family efflux transporter [Clostridia bacterium]